MNKNAIKKFAIEARKKLIDSVTDKAGMLGITEKSCSEPITKGPDFEVYQTVAGTEVTLNKRQCEQRRRLVAQIESRGFEAVVEEVAYTWFNRICAIRFMEVNDYLPNRVRVLSSEKEGKMEPDLVTQAPDVDLDLTVQEKEEIINWKMSGTSENTDKLYCKLFLKQCHQLHDILPGLFEADSDYMELLFGISYTNKDDVIYMLVNPETGIPEADFNVSIMDEEGNPTGQVEIIGWLYQYYNTELKDDTFAKLKKNVKITKERIPAATQLFTPDWIVRYMVENSVGRLWIEHLRANDSNVDEKQVAEDFGWKYYLPEAEQEDDVNIKLAEIRTTYKDLKPEDITCIDPCMGSGHILIAMFDVLMDIYKSAGYSERDAAFLIVENNIHGLDIDKRAYQLAYFAVMMKGRGYNRRFFSGKQNEDGKRVAVKPQVYVIEESNGVNRTQLKYLGADLSETEKNEALKQMNELLDELRDATEYGSILNISDYNWDLLRRFAEKESAAGQMSFETIGLEETKNRIIRLINIGQTLSVKYNVVITNPPYMSNRGMDKKLSEFVSGNYNSCKNDMFAVFIEVANNMLIDSGIYSIITQPSIISLAAFKKLRLKMLEEQQILSLLHMGRGIFGIDFGSTTFTMRKMVVKDYQSQFYKLYKRTFQYIQPEDIRDIFLCAKKEHMYFFDFDNYNSEFEDNEIEDISDNTQQTVFYQMKQSEFVKIPDNPFTYWMPQTLIESFKNNRMMEYATVTNGLFTCDNARFLRLWYEVNFTNLFLDCNSKEESMMDERKWYPYNKGGIYRKWYGNHEYVVNFKHFGNEISQYRVESGQSASFPGQDFYFEESLSWSFISASKFGIRYYPKGFVFDIAGSSVFVNEKKKIYALLALLGSEMATYILQILNPTMNYQAGNVRKLPVKEEIFLDDNLPKWAEENVDIARSDWDSYETSWYFMSHPLVTNRDTLVSKAYSNWQNVCRDRIYKMKENEKLINERVAKIYEIDDIIAAIPNDRYITVHKADLRDDICNLISYAVGCMCGRYSLDVDGLVYAGGEWDSTKYTTFIPDVDNIIPITDEEYFSDDIVGRFCEWLKLVYGEDSLEENLDFIAQALGNKGDTSREVIRNYFLNDFIKDHIKIYQKRPIYWLFDSGKANGFKSLIYMHRYNPDTVGTVRTEYLHKTQKAIEQAMERATYISSNGSGSEKAKATKQITKYTKQLAEIHTYDEAMSHMANKRIEIDLDDGVKVNYEKFQGVEVAQEGKKALKVDLLVKIK